MWGWGRLFWEEGSTIWLRQVAKECWVIDDELDRIKLDRIYSSTLRTKSGFSSEW
jgi:hypothetical protein